MTSNEPISAFAVYRRTMNKQAKKRMLLDKKIILNNSKVNGKKRPMTKTSNKPAVSLNNKVVAIKKQRALSKKADSSAASSKQRMSTTNYKTTVLTVKRVKDTKHRPVKNTLWNPIHTLPASANFADAGKDDINENPLASSQSMFEWLIHPLKVEDFFKKNWEQTPVHVKRGRPSYYKFLMSTPLMDKILRESYIQFTKNIDVTSYTNGVRETHNPPGRAVPSVVWDYYANGCSVRMSNPQTYIPKLHALNATLQEFFGCFVGANSYLTPPNSQGFAPHYDDIEAFILQVEGKKRWRLYKPRTKGEHLARFSSKNFEQSEIGEPILDVVVNAGDLLYFPRGTIHQGETIEDSHSLHITLSVYQRNCWGDYLEKLVPQALKTAIEAESEFREGLPLDYLKYTGFVHSEKQGSRRKLFKEKIKSLLNRMIDHIDIDRAADQMAKGHVHDFLPPALTEVEQECSVVKDGEEMGINGVIQNRVEIEPDTRIRLLRYHCIRLVEEEDTFKIYYSCENSKEYHEYEPQFLEVGSEFLPAVKEIILRYPEYIRVEDLPIKGEDNKIQIVKDLWEKCIVVTEYPLCVID